LLVGAFKNQVRKKVNKTIIGWKIIIKIIFFLWENLLDLELLSDIFKKFKKKMYILNFLKKVQSQQEKNIRESFFDF